MVVAQKCVARWLGGSTLNAAYRSLIRDVRRVWLHAQPGSEEAAFDEQGLVLDLLQAVPDDLDQVSEAGHGEVGQDAALEHGPDPFSRFAMVHAALDGRVEVRRLS